MSTSVSSSRPTPRGRTRRAITIICSLLCTLFVAIVVIVQGNVSGTEFAPSHFQTRTFSFYEIPLLHLQITPIRRKVTSDPASRQIRTSSYIATPRGQAPDVWHLVELSRGPSSTKAIASLLTDELTIGDSANPFWKTWNQQFPKRAAVTWPVVQRLASRELYILIPKLLQIARTFPGDDDGAKLSAEIDRWLVAEYAELVGDLREAERNGLAESVLEEAIEDYPDAPSLRELVSS